MTSEGDGRAWSDEKDEEMPAANPRVSHRDCKLPPKQLPEVALRPDRKK